MRLVVDASVAIKWVVKESDSLDAVVIRRFDLIAPELMLSECCNALWKAAQRGEIAPSDAMARMAFLTLVPITFANAQGLAERALDIAISLSHPAYDTLYIALAEFELCQVVTADMRLLRKVAGSPFSALVISLEDAAAN